MSKISNPSLVEYNMVAESNESTVIAEYERDKYKRKKTYESEAALEDAFIKLLEGQAYEYLPIKCEDDFINNLRSQLEKLNNYSFSNNEWNQFFNSKIANKRNGIEEKAKIIQEDNVQLLSRDDGTVKNIYLIDKQNIHNNSLQVINQYKTESGQRDNRYDVTVLVNGLPLVHIELKRRGVDIKEAFNQINRYNRESFWADSGLYEYIQIFVISNGTFTKYYSNTTRMAHIKEQGSKKKIGRHQSSDSFEFTSWWADAKNRPITDLMDFGRTFFAKHAILNILTKYCIFTVDHNLMVMRPYQVAATEKILGRINTAHNYKQYGSISAGGYVWHTTGSGKTLTSFKTAQLSTKFPFIEKVLFVVDRKDLDYQTMKEYDKFERGAANSNESTIALTRQLEDSKSKIIITTIQKLSIFIKKNKSHPIYGKEIVLIFDECHRSQFGDMHTAITKHFKKYYLFGFTGTPIFAKNASSSGKMNLKTTAQAFGDKLHTYTIVNAINDKNVLPFRIDYVSTMKEEENIRDEKVWNIDREKALASPKRLSNVVSYILEHFNQKTKRNSHYKVKDRRLSGFNSIFAVSSIDVAKKYYSEFQRQMAGLLPDKRLKVAIIYSFGVNEDESEAANGLLPDENSDSTVNLDQSSRDFLDSAIRDYNDMFNMNFDTSSNKFPNYYKDVSKRVKNKDVDILIVVNMFLTGFDAPTMNTLWVDKNLRLHGLLQAFSRTNRILNSIKTFGNIVCFRNLEEATNESIALFGDSEAKGIVLLKKYQDYYSGYKDGSKYFPGYESLIEDLRENFPVEEPIETLKEQKEFVKLYGTILKVKNILTTFDEFEGNKILSDFDFQDYHSKYISIYRDIRSSNSAENINDDIVFEMELIKQVDINIDYILELVEKYHKGHLKDKTVLVNIQKAVDSSVDLRNKKDLIDKFIESLSMDSRVHEDWIMYINQKKFEELDDIIAEENLNKDEAYKYIDSAFKEGGIQTTGMAVTKILPPISRFSKDSELPKKRETVLDKLNMYYEKFSDIVGKLFD